MKQAKRTAAALLAAVLTIGTIPAYAAETGVLTRGEAAERLLTAAQDYDPSVQQSDILKGYPNGDLDLDGTVTRAQALVMLDRAFGGLPDPVGDNARMAIPAESFTDVPEWASEELSDVFAAGIVAGTGDGRFSPDQPMTASAISAPGTVKMTSPVSRTRSPLKEVFAMA